MELIQVINNNKNNILKKIYVLKTLFICNQIEDLRESLEYIEEIYESLDNKINNYILSNTKESYNILDNDYHTLESLMDELREDLVRLAKMSCVIMLDNMKLNEIIPFYNKLNEVMSKYRHVRTAANFIVNNCYEDIISFLMDLSVYISNTNVPNYELLPVSYLESKIHVNNIPASEWIKLIQTIKTTIKYLNSLNDIKINLIREKFVLLNVYYFIIISGGIR